MCRLQPAAWPLWRQHLFVWMAHLAAKATDYFRIPGNRVGGTGGAGAVVTRFCRKNGATTPSILRMILSASHSACHANNLSFSNHGFLKPGHELRTISEMRLVKIINRNLPVETAPYSLVAKEAHDAKTLVPLRAHDQHSKSDACA